jgi:hypothetical protein
MLNTYQNIVKMRWEMDKRDSLILRSETLDKQARLDRLSGRRPMAGGNDPE